MALKTLVLGASPKPERYAFKAVNMLKQFGHPVVALGGREAMIGDTEIRTGFPLFENIDTITIYLGPKNQIIYYEYILRLKPRRIIFNPGTSNAFLMDLARKNGIEIIEDCTLVLLSNKRFETN